jgi:DNA-binding XRE family transcriptional regulator
VAAQPKAGSERDSVYNRLPVLRADRGISRAALADELGIHYQTIGYIERGEYAPSLNLALRIARYFELPVEAIFSVEPFGQLGAEALLARESLAPDRP